MTVARDQLRAFVERVERTEAEIADLNADKRDIYAEAKGNGFDVPTIKKVVRLRKLDASERMEADALLDIYLAALNMIEDEPASRVHVHVREGHDPETGEITEPQSSEAAAQAGRASLPATSSPVESDPVEISTPIQPESAEPSSPSIEGINEPVVMVAADANTGGKDEVGHDEDIESETGCQPAKAGLRADVEAFGSAVESGASNSADEDGAQPVEPSRGSSIEDTVRRLRPRCQNPSMCGSSGGTELCRRCKKALAEAEAA